MRCPEFLYRPSLSSPISFTTQRLRKAQRTKGLKLLAISALSMFIFSGCGGGSGFANGPRAVDSTEENLAPSPNNALVDTNEEDLLPEPEIGQAAYSLNIIHAATRSAPLTVFQNSTPVVALDYGQTSTGTGIVSRGGNDVIQLAFQNGSSSITTPTIEETSIQHTIALPLLTTSNAQPPSAWVVITESANNDSTIPILIPKDPKPVATNQVGLQILHAANEIPGETTPLNLYLLPDNNVPAAEARIGATPANATPLSRSTPQSLTTIEAAPQRMVLVDENNQTILFESEAIEWALFSGQTVLITLLDTVTQAAQTGSPVKALITGENNQYTALDQSTGAAIQVLHASPDAAALEVFLRRQNDALAPQILVPNFNYLQSFPNAEETVGVSAGSYDVFVAPDTDSVGDAVGGIDATQLQTGRDYQLILTGRVGFTSPAFQANISEQQTRPLSNKAVLEFTNTVADENETMTVFLTPRGEYGLGELLSNNMVDPAATTIAFAQRSDAIHLPAPAEYDLHVVSSDGRVYNGSLTAAEETVSPIMIIDAEDDAATIGGGLNVIALGDATETNIVATGNFQDTEGALLNYFNVPQDLYPNEGLQFEQLLLLDSPSTLTSVGVRTDWWQKRPTQVAIYTVENGQKGRLIGYQQFPEYLNTICGFNFDSPCSAPDVEGSATAELRIAVENIQTDRVIVEIDGLRSIANQFVILKGFSIYGL